MSAKMIFSWFYHPYVDQDIFSVGQRKQGCKQLEWEILI